MTVCNMSIEAGARAGLDRPRRHDLRLPRGPRPRARRAPPGSGRSTTGARCATDDGAAFDKEVVLDAAAIAPARHLGHQPRPGRRRIDGVGARPRRLRRRRRARGRRPGPSSTWASTAGTPMRDIAGRHRVHRLVHQQPHRGPAGRRRGGRGPPGGAGRARPGRARLVRGEGRRPRPRASTRSSPPPASTGASRAARCAWP